MKRRSLHFLLLLLLAVQPVVVAAADAARPWTFWYWMYGAVSKAGIRADLQAMKDVGLGGCYLMPIRGTAERPEYGGTAEQLSGTFWDMAGYALQQADSLGLEMGIHICDGFALAGGPWITPAESMQKVVFCDTVVSGGKVDMQLSRPKSYPGYYEDIACYAIPVSDDGSMPEPAVTWSPEVTRDEKGAFRASQPCWIQYAYPRRATVRSVEVLAAGTNIQSQRLQVLASDDGINFRSVKQLVPPRQGWQNYDYNSTFSLPPVTARYFRFAWTPEGTEPGSEDLDAAKWKPTLRVRGLLLHRQARINHWEGKSGLAWRVAEATADDEVAAADCVRPADIIRCTLSGDRLTAVLPKGRWKILRMGHTSTGYQNNTAGGGKGLECDKFSAAAVNKQIDHWFDRFMQKGRPRYLHVDSWECGSQNWSTNFAAEFSRRRGYSLIDYLPVMAGIPMESAAKSEQVLRDVRLTINDLLHDVFFKTVQERAHRYGCQFSAESVAPTMVADGMEHYRYTDLPMGEFWLNSPTHDKPNDMLDAISGAHIYGKPIVQAEGFTELRGVWNETPAMLKPLLDRHFALGMNRLFFHVNTHNPWTDRRPGMTLDGIGIFFQRDNTWFGKASAFVDYITRCQRMLQSGRTVVDIAVFTGEEMPRRAILPERLVPMLPGLFGRARVESEARRLANEGQPMEESPVGVNHSAGITGAADWVNALNGYHYDSMNRDALLMSTVEDGCLALPGGARYRVLVLPQHRPMTPSPVALSPEVAAKVEELRRGGVIVVDQPYTQSDFSAYGLERDIELPENMAYTHVVQPHGGEAYFVANQEERSRTVTASFRASAGKKVHIYHPLTGRSERPLAVGTSGQRLSVTFALPSHGSVFVCLSDEDSVGQSPLLRGDTLRIDTRWKLRFGETGIEQETALPSDWSKAETPEVKYYSGSAVYTATVKYPAKGGRTVLSLGRVCDVAHVWVNGIDCGIVWTAPYEADITKAVRKGKNEIKIEVVNTWANALRGADRGEPPYKGIWTNAKYRMKGDALLPAGLLGPVEVIREVAQ